MSERACAIDGCVRPFVELRRGFCSSHYWRWKKYGDPLAGPPFRAIRGTVPKRQPCTEPSGDRRSDSHYPSDDALVALMRQHHSYAKVAAACGVARESLRSFLAVRPALKAQMDEHGWKPMPADVARKRRLATARRSAARQRAADPEGTRRKRREQMRTYGPDHRHKWNHYNRLRRKAIAPPDALAAEYVKIIRSDPCVYCGAPCQHIDHIDALVNGGTGAWDNLAPTCASCNQQKHTKTLLQFMLLRLTAS